MIDKFLNHISSHSYHRSLHQSVNQQKLYYVLPLHLYGTSNDKTNFVNLNSNQSLYAIQYDKAIVQNILLNPSVGVIVRVNGKTVNITPGFELKQGDIIELEKLSKLGPNYIFLELMLRVSIKHV